MQKKFLKDVVSIVVGKQSEEIVDYLDAKKHINEFLIAKKLNLTVNQVRNLLYKLSYQGVVSYVKKKDKRKGWYTFFWRIEVMKSLEFLEKAIERKIDEIKNQIKSRETKMFYVCKRCNIEVSEETALAYDFTCQECGNVFDVKDNVLVLKDYKRNLNKLESELQEVRKELAIERLKVEKSIIRKDKKEKKKKAVERAKKRKEKVKTKEPKKVVKKKAKKKSKKISKKKVKKKPVKKKVSKKAKKKKSSKRKHKKTFKKQKKKSKKKLSKNKVVKKKFSKNKRKKKKKR